MSHRTAPSCGDTMQQSPPPPPHYHHRRCRRPSADALLSVRPSITVCLSTRAACNQGECLSPRHKLCACVCVRAFACLCVCVKYVSPCVVPPPLPLNEESFRTGEIRRHVLLRAAKQSTEIGKRFVSLLKPIFFAAFLPRWHQQSIFICHTRVISLPPPPLSPNVKQSVAASRL